VKPDPFEQPRPLANKKERPMLKTILAAGAAAFVLCGSAAAAPGTSLGVTKKLATSDVIPAQARKKWRDQRRNYRPRRGYKSPPPGYRRYDRRPGDWRRRGCLAFGPIWYCP